MLEQSIEALNESRPLYQVWATKNLTIFFWTNCNSWYSHPGHISVKGKDVLKVKAIRSGNACDWIMFKKCRNDVNGKIKQAKENSSKMRCVKTKVITV